MALSPLTFETIVANFAAIIACQVYLLRPCTCAAKMVLALQCSVRPAVQPRLLRTPCSNSAFVGTKLPRTHLRASSRSSSRQVTRMGLFGLGLPELAVIAGVAALIFGRCRSCAKWHGRNLLQSPNWESMPRCHVCHADKVS